MARWHVLQHLVADFFIHKRDFGFIEVKLSTFGIYKRQKMDTK